MDKDQKFIDMCAASTELQGAKRTTLVMGDEEEGTETELLNCQNGDMFYRPRHDKRFFVDVALYGKYEHPVYGKRIREEGDIWLPRQDQIQAIIDKSAPDIVIELKKMGNTITASISNVFLITVFNGTFDQCWLEVMMFIGFAKAWDAGAKRWVETINIRREN